MVHGSIQATTVPHSEIFRVDVAHHRYPLLSEIFWAHLGRLDSYITAPNPDTVGHALGEYLQVQWWTDESGCFFAAQVIDGRNGGVWEVFHVPAGAGQPVVGHRVCTGSPDAVSVLEALWLEVFADLLSEAVSVKRHPTFVELVAAGSSPAGVIAVQDDLARIARLQSEVDYWSHLAKSMDKAINLRASTYQHTSFPAALPVPSEPAEGPRQWALKDISEWAHLNSDRIIIMQRAVSTTKRGSFENAALLYECLELLANEYTQVKTGKADRNAFKNKADSMGVEYGGSVEPSVAGELGDLYFIRWQGRRQFLDQHLSKGNARDPRFCLRIYFYFCPIAERVIVGHMPTHLPTGRS